jgi:multiple sugar transport system permease protein
MTTAVSAPTTARRRTARRGSRGGWRGWLTVAVLIVVSFFVLLPFIWMLSASFRTEGDLTGNPTSLWPSAFTLQNYVQIWTQIPFAQQFLNSIAYAGTVTLVSVVLDSLAGYAFARYDFPGKKLLFIGILITLMLPIQVTFIPVYNLLVHLGWVNSLQGLIVPRIADAFGIFFMRQYFLGLPKDLEEAARIDGASEARIFFRVMLPLATSAVLTIAMFNLLANWNDLLWPLMVTTDPSMETLPAGLALFKGQHVSNYGLLMAGSVLSLIPMLIVFFFVQRRFIEGIATTGLK